jgi:hypothetical protein
MAGAAVFRPHHAGHVDARRPPPAGFQTHVEDGTVLPDLARLAELDPGPAPKAVPLVPQGDAVGAGLHPGLATLWGVVLHLEDVREVRSEADLQPEPALLFAVVLEDQVLVDAVRHDPVPANGYGGILAYTSAGERAEDAGRVVLAGAAGEEADR